MSQVHVAQIKVAHHTYKQITSHPWKIYYGVATDSRIDQITGLFCRIWSLLQGSVAKET